MPSHLNRGRFPLAWIAVLLAAGTAESQETRRAQLHVRLPADAQLTIDGHKTRQTGATRLFYSPPLVREKSYHYTFVWTYRKDGKTYRASKVIYCRAGDNPEEDLRNVKGEEVETEGTESSTNPARKLDVKFVETPPEVVNKMLQMAGIKASDVVYDLGCGDGRIVIAAADKYKCKAVGFDLDDKRVREAKAKVMAAALDDQVTIEKKDLFEVDLKPASVIMLYLRPDLNDRLVPQLKQLKPGSRIVSHNFEIKGYPPKETATVPVKGESDHKVYLWEAPLKKE
jgi:uncharacterized protein (TIGR03000 family)